MNRSSVRFRQAAPAWCPPHAPDFLPLQSRPGRSPAGTFMCMTHPEGDCPESWLRSAKTPLRQGDQHMQMLSSDEIVAADLADWRKLGQGLHARFVIDDFVSGARFVAAAAAA